MPKPTLFESLLHEGLRHQESPGSGTKTGGTSRAPRAGKSLVAGTLKVLLAAVTAAARALLVCATVFAVSARAVTYDFFTVTITSTNTAKITSPNGNGYITVTTVGSNILPLNNTDFPTNEFPNLFLASGQVDGYITRYNDLSTNTTTFVITNYQFTPKTVFGIWNMTEESNTYSIKAYAGNTQNAPVFTWSLMGYDDNSLQGNIGWVHIVLDPNTGVISTTNFTTTGVDSDGIFWTNLPTATTKIVITGNVPKTGPGGTNFGDGDGVVYYFAEPRPCSIICPSNIVITACGGTNVYFPTPTLDGDCGTNTPQLLSDLASGSFFHVGTNLVVWYVPGYPNSSCSFTVTVINTDTNPPVINCPSNIVVFTCSTNAVANYAATATDDSSNVTVIYSSPSGSTFPLGTNTVYCSASDDCSNVTSCQFDVIVLPYPPVWGVICPKETFTTNVTGCPPIMPNLTNLVTITNQCSIPGGLSITQSPPAGTVLSAGNYQVTLTVCATNGACQNCYVTVNAFLGTGCCTISCPTNPITVTTCGSNAVVTFATPAISGPCASNSTVFCAPPSGSTFPLGTNTVVCLATNGAGATLATCSFNVIVAASAFTNAYDFLPVTITGSGAKFSSLHGYGVITVTNTGGPFLSLNNTVWASQFTNLFPASGTVTGWLAQADNFARYTNTFYLAGYILKTNTVFGMWNITEETNTYSIRLLDASGSQIAPIFNWNFLGYDDDALAGNIAWYHMNLNTNTGIFSPVPYKISGIDCDGAFWDNIPLNTRKIVVTGTLGALNADGVVFYFAERRPCPTIPCKYCGVAVKANLAGTNVVLSWQPDAPYLLEQTAELAGPLANWTPVTNAPAVVNNEYQVTLPAQDSHRYYRLEQMPTP